MEAAPKLGEMGVWGSGQGSRQLEIPACHLALRLLGWLFVLLTRQHSPQDSTSPAGDRGKTWIHIPGDCT